MNAPSDLTNHWRSYLRDCAEVAATVKPVNVTGRLTKVTGLVMEAVGLRLAVGSCCTVNLPNGNNVEAEVVGFSDDRLFLMPTNDVHGLTPGARVMQAEPKAIPSRPGGAPRPRRRASDYAKHVPVGPGGFSTARAVRWIHSAR
jgi:flagellum-specific ATP synthase